MKILISFLLYLVSFYTLSAQIELTKKDSIPLVADQLWGIDSFDGIYYSKDNILHKNWNTQQLQFGDYSLGELSSVSILNPLKIILFYQTSNTIVLIDKYFNEIDRINFNTLPEFKNVTHVAAANDNSVWIFDANNQQLELFDTDLRKTLITTLPINELPKNIQSNFNFCWIMTETEIFQYNIYGTLVDRFENKEYSNFCIADNQLILKEENELYYYENENKRSEKINLPQISIKQFQVTNEILYIYDLTKIYSFKLTSPEK